jgi:hypothetical protein
MSKICQEYPLHFGFVGFLAPLTPLGFFRTNTFTASFAYPSYLAWTIYGEKPGPKSKDS